ncbi:MAG: exonuclease SbcCD subunit D [Aromatoleum sp.]|uniref:exonuclease SbcCD subunit D n=1 Tax=Aromatoleum sp. TaxID=2307007 RepID=UPI002894E6E6|nr:exonuclease SbcCD subunit D [Aromatoleum sp.]MDT3669787.1 exonuclease SbcCD subunit D [Aromatoleum sp.]
MRFLHTADWHLGRLFHARSLVDDQAHVLDQFVALVRDTRPDAVLIAGDVYDRAVPPPEAVNLLDDTLSRIVIGEGVPVVLIAGNHDSPDRLGFGSRLLAARGLAIASRPRADVEGIAFDDAHGRVVVYPLPYSEPAVVRDAFALETADHDVALGRQLDAIRSAHRTADRSVVLAHAFVAGAASSESERPLSVGGSGAVAAARFADFDFVALGHLHRPQRLGADHIGYSGSLLKYSLSEAGHDKSVSLVELGARGDVRVEPVALTPRRDLRLIRGDLATLIAAGRDDGAREDYVFASLTDAGALLDPVARLREVYPNVLGCERVVLAQAGVTRSTAQRQRELDTGELFGDFFREVTGEPLADPARDALLAVIDRLEVAGREAQ